MKTDKQAFSDWQKGIAYEVAFWNNVYRWGTPFGA